MKIDAHVVSKNIPDWMDGNVFALQAMRETMPVQMTGPERHGPVRFVMFSKKKPTLVWPRWWHRLGKFLGWRWLANLDDGFN